MITFNSPSPVHAILKDDMPKEAPGHVITRIQERIQAHHREFHEATDYYFEKNEFGATGGDAYRYKARPYSNWDNLMNLQRLGHIMRNQSTAAIAIHENFTSYAIGKGISFDVKVKRRYKQNKETVEQAYQLQDWINEFISLQCWAVYQEEAIDRRLMASGELIRRWDQVDGKLDWAFVDAHELRPPSGKKRGAKTPGQTKWGIEYQVINNKPNMRFPLRYWVDDEAVPKEHIQHVKIGCDSRDPRGTPMLWAGYPTAREIDELDYGAGQVALEYAKHAIWYKYDDDVAESDMLTIAKRLGQIDQWAESEGKLNASGAVHHARRYEVSDLSSSWTASGFINLIDFKCRWLGNIASIPEFISTGRADTGSRNTLISAENPLVRRVFRVAQLIAKADIRLLWALCAIRSGKFDDEAWLDEVRSRIEIVPNYTIPDGRDSVAREKSVLTQIEAEVLDPIAGIRELGRDPHDVLEGHRLWAEATGDMRDQLRDLGRMNDFYTAEQLAKRIDTVAALISVGFTEDEAMERAGLDVIDDRSRLDEAIEMRKKMAQIANVPGKPGPDADENPDEEPEPPRDDRRPDFDNQQNSDGTTGVH